MLNHRGFSAWIEVEGKPLPEYLVAVDSKAHKVSCWIPSEEGQNFTVFWKDHGGKVDTCAFITLDGFVVPGRFLFGEGVASRQGVRTSTSTERSFVFQKVEEAGHGIADTGNKDVGIISLRIKQVERVSTRPANEIQKLPQLTLGKRKIGEICVGFGAEIQSHDQYATTWSVKPYNPDAPGEKKASTFVSFVFRYRSRDFLESQGILTEPEVNLLVPKRLPVRRVVSMPPAMPTHVSDPPKKKPRLTSFSPTETPQRKLNRPSPETRRAVSYMIQNKSEGFPGEGMILFYDESEKHEDSGESSTEVGESQSSTG